jgi:hypothetical protein
MRENLPGDVAMDMRLDLRRGEESITLIEGTAFAAGANIVAAFKVLLLAGGSGGANSAKLATAGFTVWIIGDIKGDDMKGMTFSLFIFGILETLICGDPSGVPRKRFLSLLESIIMGGDPRLFSICEIELTISGLIRTDLRFSARLALSRRVKNLSI